MDDVTGIVSALTVILLGLALFVAMALRRQRVVEAGGYVKTEAVEHAINELTRTLFEAAPAEVHRREEPSGSSWLVFVDAGSSEESGCVMLVYRVARDDWPAVALVQSGRPIPKIFRRLTGGFFNWAEPMAETEQNGLAGTGWFAYQAPHPVVPAGLKRRMCAAVRVPGAPKLLGLAVIDSHLAIWSDAGRLKTLLATAPLIRAVFLEQSREA